MAYRLTKAAVDQIETILKESAQGHGADAASRYAQLITIAISALGNQPLQPGSREIPHRAGARAYALRHSRAKVQPPDRVGKPRHLIIYRIAPDGAAEILGLVHERMILPRATLQLLRNVK